eukprot:COSAG04_NODE_328_length_16610_cov_3.679668_8_plen_731_part_00
MMCDARGQLSVVNSPLLPPAKTPLSVLHFPPGVLEQNPKSGPGVSPGNSFFSMDYSLVAHDERGNRRDGTDQLFVRVSLAEDWLLDAPSKAVQPELGTVWCFATRALQDKTNRSLQPWGATLSACSTLGVIHAGGSNASVCLDHGHDYDEAGNAIKQPVLRRDVCYAYGFGCDWDRAECESHGYAWVPESDDPRPGVYNFTAALEGVHGVLQADAWLCPLDQMHSDVHSCFTSRAPGRRADAPLKGASLGQPRWITHEAGSLAVKAENMPMVFTVCPPNSDTALRPPEVAEANHVYGFAEGAHLHTCSCKSGYMGRSGDTCAACPAGKFSSSEGSMQCRECAAGRHCSCATTGMCGNAFGVGHSEPACAACLSCPVDTYQNLDGQEECNDCSDGFNCSLKGTTYPVAQEGYYADPRDPTRIHLCTIGSLKTGPGHYEDRGMACPGGDRSLARALQCHTDVFGELVSSADPDRSEECAEAVGAVCRHGYAGSALCERCCRQDDADQTSCGGEHPNWFLDGNRQCTPCPVVVYTVASLLGPLVLALIAFIVLGPAVLKVGKVVRQTSGLQAPIMSLINFFQAADLFHDLDLRWPPAFETFVRRVASLFNFTLPNLPFTLHRPECAYTVPYAQQWALVMASPILVVLALLLFVLLRCVLAWLALWLLDHLYRHKRASGKRDTTPAALRLAVGLLVGLGVWAVASLLVAHELTARRSWTPHQIQVISRDPKLLG